MAKNTGEGKRQGVVKGRTQYYNEKTKTYVKRDTKTGRFVSGSKTPYKAIKKEK